ncbi:MAG: DUF167 domain-containing protein [Chloroflexi bacterium]|nr:DUF167 domain-containing protein [Chloroflexota bacterium]
MDLDIRVQPRASRNTIEIDSERIKVRVTAAPEGGKANDAVVALLAKRLRVPKSSVRIVRGHKSRDKRIRIEGISTMDALRVLRTERG